MSSEGPTAADADVENVHIDFNRDEDSFEVWDDGVGVIV